MGGAWEYGGVGAGRIQGRSGVSGAPSRSVAEPAEHLEGIAEPWEPESGSAFFV